MKIGMLSTSDTNIGDDFIRDGIQYLLSAATEQSHEHVIVNKHRPFSAVRPIVGQLLGRLPQNMSAYVAASPIGQLIGQLCSSVFDNCDLLVQGGTPIIWHGCGGSEWAGLVYRGIFSRLVNRHDKILFNVGGGSGFAWWEREGVKLAPKDRQFIKFMANISALLTVRDTLAKELFAKNGAFADLMPCPAFLSPKKYATELVQVRENNYSDIDVVFNYMEGGGHPDYGQLKFSSLWKAYFSNVYHHLRSRGIKTAFVCHDQMEVAAAKRIDSDALILMFRSPREYFLRLVNVKAAFVNRLHAAVGLGGAGVPCIAVGTDTRMLMVSEFQIPCYWVGALPEEAEIVEKIEHFMSDNSERQRLIGLSDEIEAKYLTLFRNALNEYV